MCKTRSFSALAASACWLVAGVAPLMAQTADGPGVTVDLGGAMLMHRTAVAYPAAALARQIEGTVSVQATLDAKGNVRDAHVVGGPDELRKTALLSVLDWHFANASAGATRLVSITFLKPPQVNQPTAPAGQMTLSSNIGTGFGGVPGTISQQTAVVARSTGPRTVKSIAVYGLPDQSKNDLISGLPVHVGDVLTTESTAKLIAAVKQYDEHLTVGTAYSQAGETEIRISVPGAGMSPGVGVLTGLLAASTAPQAIPVSGDAPQAAPLKRVIPVYPPEARQIRLQGVVRLKAVIAKDGTVQSLTVVSGHPLLVQPALDAAKQWLYKPTLLNGQPVEVATDIEINFTMADPPAQQ